MVANNYGNMNSHQSVDSEWGSKQHDLDEISISARSWNVARQIMDSDVQAMSFGRRGHSDDYEDNNDENDDTLSFHPSRRHDPLSPSAARVSESETSQTMNLYDLNDTDLNANGMYRNSYHHQPRHGAGLFLRCFACWTETVRISRRTYGIILAVILVLLIIAIPLGVTIRNNNNNAVPSAVGVNMTYRPTLPPHTFQNHEQSFTHGLVSSLLMHFGILDIHAFENVNSPQRRAVEYLVGSTLSKTKLNSDGFNQDWKSEQNLRNLVDLYALAVMFYDTSGFQWASQSKWLDPKLENPCAWHGITCAHDIVVVTVTNSTTKGVSSSANKTVLTVVRINLQDNGMMGTLPTELRYLNALQELDVSKNALQGTLPLESLPASLQTLSLAKNRFSNLPSTTGTTTTWQQQLSNLQVLDLHENDLHGPFQSSSSAMSALRTLNLQHNFLTGTVPTFPQLEELQLDMNRFSGSLPWNLPTSLKELSVRQNRLQGSFPDNMVELSKLENLNVGRNGMTGTLDVCSKLVFLRQLVLDQNSFTGTLPSLASPLLTQYIVSTNQLRGTIPASVGVLWNLEVLALDHNAALNGTLVPSQPPQLEQLTKLSILNLVETNIDGTLSQTLANQLQELHLSAHLVIGGSRR